MLYMRFNLSEMSTIMFNSNPVERYLSALSAATTFDANVFTDAIVFYILIIIEKSCRGLKNILRLHVKKVNCSEWEHIPVPKRYG